ncbi:PAS domain S-box protein [archaeon]|nr:MAG: PAS domain S-box protein [archaeon]
MGGCPVFRVPPSGSAPAPAMPSMTNASLPMGGCPVFRVPPGGGGGGMGMGMGMGAAGGSPMGGCPVFRVPPAGDMGAASGLPMGGCPVFRQPAGSPAAWRTEDVPAGHPPVPPSVFASLSASSSSPFSAGNLPAPPPPVHRTDEAARYSGSSNIIATSPPASPPMRLLQSIHAGTGTPKSVSPSTAAAANSAAPIPVLDLSAGGAPQQLGSLSAPLHQQAGASEVATPLSDAAANTAMGVVDGHDNETMPTSTRGDTGSDHVAGTTTTMAGTTTELGDSSSITYTDATSTGVHSELGATDRAHVLRQDLASGMYYDGQVMCDDYEGFDSVIQSIEDLEATIMIDAKGTVVSASAATCAMFGYWYEDLIGHNVKVLMPPHIADLHDEYLADYKASQVKRMLGNRRTVEAMHRDGAPVAQHALHL